MDLTGQWFGVVFFFTEESPLQPREQNKKKTTKKRTECLLKLDSKNKDENR